MAYALTGSHDSLLLKIFGVPLHAWTHETIKNLSDQCGGVIGIDEGSKTLKIGNTSHGISSLHQKLHALLLAEFENRCGG